ncbi:hypothetical protein P7K49_038368 [Saguinus oedipus]|uniref:IF rod domain-containing protein n=1 Tax=Saguinus oedipus TaxID=9490 RepID=A0ABQ9TEG8_SAGOE|nr:hypothetical protein P7K49_038368 [Saguinus oedipus]
MRFTTRSTFSTNYRFLGSIQMPSYGAWLVRSAASIYAGAGGSGSWMSLFCSNSFWGSMGSQVLAMGMARVRSLKTENQKLESKIWEHLEKKGPQVRDWSHYFKTIEDLRAQIFPNTVDNGRIVLQIDNAHLADDDFRVKYETELAMHHSMESDIHGLCKIEESITVVTTQSTEVGAAEMTLMELRCTVQSLVIELDSMRNLKASLENSLREVEVCYALQMEQLNRILLHLESELAQTWVEG